METSQVEAGKEAKNTARIALQFPSPSTRGSMMVPGFKLSLLNAYLGIKNTAS